uniref:Lipoprotein n=1 Tax=uncultured bacterium contig00110(2014) TaxID=1465632 RepID=A0A060D1F9_9BACT|nr:hypothetical protein [uncultured bacterium contig00110(2014)]
MRTKNNFRNNCISIAHYTFAMAITLICFLTACSPNEDDSHKLGGTVVEMPQNWKVEAVDNNNEVVITFDPLDMINGDDILGVQFACPEAGINFTVKDATITTLSKKVYRSGEYKLYIAAVTRAGAGIPREVPFTVSKNLLLETLSPDVLPQEVTINIDDNGHVEKFYKGELYIEESSEITLTGAIASEDAIVNLDFFKRESATTVKFLGKSGVYSLYWNPVRKNIIIEPTTAIEKPNYFVFTGPGIGYPTTVSSEEIKAAYGAGDGRYTTAWDPGRNILTRVVMRNTGTDTYEATICINQGATFKPFSNANWGDDLYAAQNCTFTGSPIFNSEGDWSPNSNLDKDGYYRITLNSATKAVIIRKVSATGEVIEEDIDEGGNSGIDPNTPIKSENFDLATHSIFGKVKDESYRIMFFSLEKGAEYTLAGNLADSKIVYNVDFFERVGVDKVRFLGETGDYRLYYNPIRRNVLIGTDAPRYPNYLIACGIGLGSPTKISSDVIGTYYKDKDWYTTEWDTKNVMQYILFRKISDNKYQATVFAAPEGTSFKPFENTTNWWDGGKAFSSFSFTGESIFKAGDDGNWEPTPTLVAGQAYRITVDLGGNSVNISKFTLP